jgi:hypothetical protein
MFVFSMIPPWSATVLTKGDWDCRRVGVAGRKPGCLPARGDSQDMSAESDASSVDGAGGSADESGVGARQESDGGADVCFGVAETA